ncbi:helix-turn-helix domain-containing protein [Fusobacterium perfoetens]|uniref:helix-turn-helix domain-containing protein n=1 Tax=Fusobacterium perfoetens TaxID=852 RepID=UPI001F21C0F2|nr:helix-turn-helix transcriptional regulator [Fusobacterium perfoetens]MCF2612885.1 helix-turn-helix domain-containing protein [Fusobacterium perfoetens]
MEVKYTKTQETIARRLKEKREEKGFTLEEAAKHINVSKVTLHRYENLNILNIPSDKIETLAKLYGTTPKYIMGWSDDDAVTPKEEVSPTYRWVARNAKKMNEKELEKLQSLMKLTFDIFDDEEE